MFLSLSVSFRLSLSQRLWSLPVSVSLSLCTNTYFLLKHNNWQCTAQARQVSATLSKRLFSPAVKHVRNMVEQNRFRPEPSSKQQKEQNKESEAQFGQAFGLKKTLGRTTVIIPVSFNHGYKYRVVDMWKTLSCENVKNSKAEPTSTTCGWAACRCGTGTKNEAQRSCASRGRDEDKNAPSFAPTTFNTEAKPWWARWKQIAFSPSTDNVATVGVTEVVREPSRMHCILPQAPRWPKNLLPSPQNRFTPTRSPPRKSRMWGFRHRRLDVFFTLRCFSTCLLPLCFCVRGQSSNGSAHANSKNHAHHTRGTTRVQRITHHLRCPKTQ